MIEENRLTMFSMLFFAAMVSNFSFWISSFNIYLMFKNMHRLFREDFSHVATKYLSYIRIYLFKSMLNEARIIPTLQIVQLLYPWSHSWGCVMSLHSSPCLYCCGIWGQQDTWGCSSIHTRSKGTPSKELDWGWTVHVEVKTEQALAFSSVWILLTQCKGLVPA